MGRRWKSEAPPTLRPLPPHPSPRGDSVTQEPLLIGWQPKKGVNQLFEFVLMHNDVAARKKNLLRLERLEDLAFFKSRAHWLEKEKCMQDKKEGGGLSEDPKGHMFNPVQHEQI